MSEGMEITGTFKQRKVELVKEGFDPREIKDAIYFRSPVDGHFVPVDAALYERICGGEIRL